MKQQHNLPPTPRLLKHKRVLPYLDRLSFTSQTVVPNVYPEEPTPQGGTRLTTPLTRKYYKARRSESQLTPPRQKRRENSTLSDYKDISVPRGHINLSKYSAPDDNVVRENMIDTVIHQRSIEVNDNDNTVILPDLQIGKDSIELIGDDVEKEKIETDSNLKKRIDRRELGVVDNDNDMIVNVQKAQDSKTDFVEHIKECTKGKTQLLSNIIRKNKKVLDVLVHRKKDTFTKASLVTLDMKNISQQLETNTNELTKFRLNTNAGSSISLIKELQSDTFFTQVNLENNVKNKNTKDKGNQLLRQIQKDKYDIKTTKDIRKNHHEITF